MSTEIECIDYENAKLLCRSIADNAKHVTAIVRSARNNHWAVVITPKVKS